MGVYIGAELANLRATLAQYPSDVVFIRTNRGMTDHRLLALAAQYQNRAAWPAPVGPVPHDQTGPVDVLGVRLL